MICVLLKSLWLLEGLTRTFYAATSQSFDDLHRLWFILYKERNLILTEKQKRQKAGTPTTPKEELRYSKVKQSMASIKHVLGERTKIKNLIAKQEAAKSLPIE
jgi:hypothetical protein